MGKLKFISYDGGYPNLCSGILVISVDDVIYNLKYCLLSGGSVSFTDDGDEIVECGEWLIDEDILPNEILHMAKEIKDIVNENVEFGCCGGCI